MNAVLGTGSENSWSDKFYRMVTIGYLLRQRERETERQTDRQTDKQTDRQTDRNRKDCLSIRTRVRKIQIAI